MVITKASSILFFFLFISFFVPLTHGKKEFEALTQLYKAKFKKNSTINTSNFQKNLHLNKPHVFAQEGLKEKDRIHKLPGQPNVGFTQYGGYVTVNQSAGRALYYYFVEAPKNKNSLPLVIWLNGGPGCSSMAGAMVELGPFRPNSDGKTLYRNPYAWNQVANVLFLESPAGVGFSYSNTTSDFTSGGDNRTASDNLVFLINWLERFPEYKTRNLYICGESYAGHYVPELAHNILQHNKMTNRTLINLKGIMIGNAVINDLTDTSGTYDYWATHALISDKTLIKIRKHCNFSPNSTTNVSNECTDAVTEAYNDVQDLNQYDIYASLCFSSNLTAKPKKASVLYFDPCILNYLHAYMNRPEVQKALHANVTHISYDWELCSTVLQTWEDSPATMIPLLQEFMENKIRLWMYSGDVDGVVPVTSSKYSINTMKLPVTTEWHPWFLKGEVGGYAVVYNETLTFATVRGAGHQVPSYSPRRALSLITHFLSGASLPNSTSTSN